jgi:hypothetical protein
LSYKYTLNPKYSTFKNSLLDIKIIFNSSDTSIHKARNELKTIEEDNVKYVIKSFKKPNIINQIAYSFFKDSKAKKSYMNALKIQEFTPDPVGFIEFYSFGLLKKSYFVSKEFQYDFTIREPLLDEKFNDRESIFRAFAQFTFNMHQNNIFHNDYSPGNILIKKSITGKYIFKVVDINRMKFFSLNENDRAKNFAKLWASDDILRIIAEEYLKHYQITSEQEFIENVLRYSQDNKNFKNFKKHLKGQEVTD